MLVSTARSLLATVSLVALIVTAEAAEAPRVVVWGPLTTGSIPSAPTAPTLAPATTSAIEFAPQPGKPVAPGTVARAAPEQAAPAEPVDDSALRYYASQNATQRVEAEIRRLRSLHPGWEPPADLYKPSRGNEEQGLWDLYAADRIDDLRAEIERRSSREPGWRPSADLDTKIRLKEVRRKLIQASEKTDHAAVIELARANAGLVAEDDPDIIWRVAEAYGKTGEHARAVELYALVLDSPAPGDVRLATIRKALGVIPASAAEPLLAKSRRGADGRDEFEPVRDDLVRARIGQVLTAAVGVQAAPADVQRLTALAEAQSGTAADAELLGWLHYRAEAQRGQAKPWFDKAVARGGGLKPTLGLALSARALGDLVAAEKLAYDNRLADDQFASLYIEILASELTREKPPVIAPDRLVTYAAEVKRLESGNGAQALGWYAYKARQFPAALAWFETALKWQPNSKTAEGHLLAMLGAGDRARFLAELPVYKAKYPDLAAFVMTEPKRESASARPAGAGRAAAGGSSAAFAAHKRGDHRLCLDLLAQRAGRGGLSSEDELLRGWCLLELNRPQEAAFAFGRAQQTAASQRRQEDAAYGRSLAHLRSGKTIDAAYAAASSSLAPKRQAEIAQVVLAQHAIAYFDRHDYAQAVAMLDQRRRLAEEPRDLMTMRAWAYYHLGQHAAARELFAFLDQQMSTRETRSGLASVQARLPDNMIRW
ncbi:MAG: hypothetical protein JNM13_13455 [Hyphomicrobiaceae bacterium]|nr:hypothetical protein [Hyphomicrobiaceae bacterium]